jgi:hypothetical protein
MENKSGIFLMKIYIEVVYALSVEYGASALYTVYFVTFF